MLSRRQFITATGAVGVASLFPGRSGDSVLGAKTPRRDLSILILGGTSFLGPHQIAYALERGHSITTFTRGRSQPSVHRGLFDRVESLVGDREDDLTALEGRRWDAVIDNSGRRVHWTRATAELLRDSADRYLYTSSTGVFYPYLEGGMTEDSPVVLEAPEGEERAYEFGTMKANSEIAAREAFGEDRTIIVRPTFMMGPADNTDRFMHWPLRLREGGEVLVPGNADDPVQFIDVRDVAEFMIRLIEGSSVGVYNAAGPEDSMGMLEFVRQALGAFERASNLTVIDDYAFLREHRIGAVLPWIMPVGESYGTARISNDRARRAGLSFRPVARTLTDLLAWWEGETVLADRRDAYLANERSLLTREAAVLAAWAARG